VGRGIADGDLPRLRERWGRGRAAHRHPGFNRTRPGRREYQRRRDAREQHARVKLGSLGVVLAKVIDEPASTRVWQQGATGEVRVAKRLEKHLDGGGVRLLHDRGVPGHGQANIDQLAIGPGGVTVIDAKTHRGKITRDWSGGLFVERRIILRINGAATRPSSSPGSRNRSATSAARSPSAIAPTSSTSLVRCALPTSTACPCSGGSRSAESSSTDRNQSHTSPPARGPSTPRPSSRSGRISPARFRPPDQTESDTARFTAIGAAGCLGSPRRRTRRRPNHPPGNEPAIRFAAERSSVRRRH
jgi:hypothetical protein